MTQETPFYGEVINGKRAQVVFGTYSGIAAVRERDGYTEVAYRGPAPTTFPCKGTIDRDDAEAVRLRDKPGKAGDLVVLIVR